MVPNIMPHVSSKQHLTDVATGDTGSSSGTGSEGVGVEALVTACMGYLSTYARCIRAIGLLAALYRSVGDAPEGGGLRPPCNDLILSISHCFGHYLKSELQIQNMQHFMKWCIMYP